MNSTSITDYILKLEKENRDQAETIRTLTFNEIDLKKQIRDFKKKSPDSYEVSRTKIEALKKLLAEANEEKVDALNELNELKYMMRVSPSYTDTTARVTKKSLNDGLVKRLLELGNMTSDFHKSLTYQKAADAVANLPHEVESGESLMHIQVLVRVSPPRLTSTSMNRTLTMRSLSALTPSRSHPVMMSLAVLTHPLPPMMKDLSFPRRMMRTTLSLTTLVSLR
jgi:hypothetical protein